MQQNRWPDRLTTSKFSFNGKELQGRVRNTSDSRLSGDLVFLVTVEDCVGSGDCVTVGQSNYVADYVRIPSGQARDVVATNESYGIDNIDPQGQLRFDYELKKAVLDRECNLRSHAR